jgi:hypothetical protein
MKLWRAILPYYVVLGAICLPGAAILNAHLLNQRPVVAGQDENGRPNILCGRVSGPLPCGRISETDRRAYTALVVCAILALPGALFLAFSLYRSSKAFPRLGLDR